MPIPTFDTLDAVPEPFRPFAREADGKVVLDLVEGAEVVGLKRKNAELLAAQRELRDRFADVDVEEYRTLKAAGSKVQDLDARLKAAAEKERELQTKLDAVQAARRGDFRSAAITRELAAASANTELLAPIVERYVDVQEAEGRLQVVVKDATGNVRYKDGQGTPFAVADLLAEFKANPTYAPAFLVTPPSGGGAAPAGAGGAVKTVNIRDEKAFAANLDDIARGKVKFVGA